MALVALLVLAGCGGKAPPSRAPILTFLPAWNSFLPCPPAPVHSQHRLRGGEGM